MYKQILSRNRKHFCRYSLQSFITAQTLERHFNDSYRIITELLTSK